MFLMTARQEDTDPIHQRGFLQFPNDTHSSGTPNSLTDEDKKQFLKVIVESAFLVSEIKGRPSCKVCKKPFKDSLEVLEHVPEHFSQNPFATESVQKGRREEGGSVGCLLRVRDPSTINNLAAAGDQRLISDATSPPLPLENRPPPPAYMGNRSHELPPDLLNFVLERREQVPVQPTWYVHPTERASNPQ